ncbi:hypothetical protein CC2G_001986 [Coprinopsis cinerea AmutBmut pab1-1]|nr:hypothetical protein CC2G_001986 [Coprinopsis cinerea AmutBmut pab1-1]
MVVMQQHAAITDTPAVSAVSYLGLLQLFQNRHGNAFTPLTNATLRTNSNYFALIPHIQFLTVLPSKTITLQPNGGFLLDQEFLLLVRSLSMQSTELEKALKLWKGRKKDEGDLELADAMND